MFVSQHTPVCLIINSTPFGNLGGWRNYRAVQREMMTGWKREREREREREQHFSYFGWRRQEGTVMRILIDIRPESCSVSQECDDED